MNRRTFFGALAALVGAFGLRLKAAPRRYVRPYSGKALRYYRYMVEQNQGKGAIHAGPGFHDALYRDLVDERMAVNLMYLENGQRALAPSGFIVPVLIDRSLGPNEARWVPYQEAA